MPSLGEYLSGAGVPETIGRTIPLWKGPESDEPMGGITQSLLSRFIVDRERFRLLVIDGLKPSDKWSPRLGYGSMWHVCEEEYSRSRNDPSSWIDALRHYCAMDLAKYQFQRGEIERWYSVCRTQFQVYVDWWSKHPEHDKRRPIIQEQEFKVPHTLPNSRVVYLRGKWDGVDEYKGLLWLREHKTKGDIDWFALRRQLSSGFDLQTMLYLVALRSAIASGREDFKMPLGGVRYNVIRRPLAGGKCTIQQSKGTNGTKCSRCKGTGQLNNSKYIGQCPNCDGAGRSEGKPAETDTEFYDRLGREIEGAVGIDYGVAADEHYFFQRWKIELTDKEIDRFCNECLNPLLDQLCIWWDHISGESGKENPFWCAPSTDDNLVHWRTPLGIWNPLLEGRDTEYDQYLLNGDETGLQRTDELFPELVSDAKT